MSDLIRRADAIKALYKYNFVSKDVIERQIKAIPSVDIPHSDDWEKYSDKLWKNAYERGKADRPQGNLIKLIEAQKQLIEEYERKITLLEERNGLLEKAIRDLVRIAKGADDDNA